MPTTENLISQFFAVGRVIKHQMDSGSPRITLPQLETLRFLQEHRAASMRQIANFLAVTPPSATIAIRTLASAGLISRRRDNRNRRMVYLHLTKKGQTLLDTVFKQRCLAFRQLLKRLNKTEQQELFRLMRKLAAG